MLGNKTRSDSQELWDQFFLLSLFQCSDEPLDNLKIQKIIFISEDKARREKLAAAHFPFFRYNLGPYSKVVANDVRRLEDLGFIEPETKKPTKRGQFVLAYLDEFAQASKEASQALSILGGVCKSYRDFRSSQLVDAVYGMEVSVIGLNGEIMRVRDIPLCTDILDPNREHLKDFSALPDDVVEDLKTEFSLTSDALDPANPSNIDLARAILTKALSI
jgi:hypothetical protein